ncbi:MAG: divergent polysaccharide deacetylase family protein [Candidatus Neomarinimicrobiota bacterium]|nr:divergent polysaccharide deacetylase family protein [Candidatus Neomarinimicrobiota bacterium]|tara:strand:+ start:3916 stop:4782 length:867 start_codon:yes stop_codon:yes gene_type:complete
MQQDYKTLAIYVLTLFVVVLLIVLKKQQDHLTDLENDIVETEITTISPDTIEEQKSSQSPVETAKVPMRGVIGLIIDDFGYRNDHVSNGFLQLPGKLTYAIIPGHDYSQLFSKKAYDSGYEIIVHLPMENIGKTYGEEEYVLMSYFQDDEIKNRINKAFDYLPESIGLNNHQGSRGTADSRVMTLVAGVIKEKKKFFIDSRTTNNSLAETTMRKYGVPTNKRDIFLDNELDEEKIKIQLLELADVSEEKGIAIGIGHVKPQTLNVLAKEIPVLQEKGFRFEFVSKLVY